MKGGRRERGIASQKGNGRCGQHPHRARPFVSRNRVPSEFTGFYSACKYGHVKVVAYLISQGVDCSIAIKDGFTPLHACAYEVGSPVGCLRCLWYISICFLT